MNVRFSFRKPHSGRIDAAPAPHLSQCTHPSSGKGVCLMRAGLSGPRFFFFVSLRFGVNSFVCTSL
jgi:hypothetical protein